MVLELDVVSEDVGSRPCLSEGEAVLSAVELCLKVSVDGARLGVAEAEDTESETVGRLSLYLEGGAVDGAGDFILFSIFCEGSIEVQRPRKLLASMHWGRTH